MKRSSDRILTSHVGSLIRPPALQEFLRDKQAGKPYDKRTYERCLTESVAGIVRAIQYAVSVAGVDHVGLGSDFDGATTAPFDTTGIPLITEGLRSASVSDEDIAKIMGGNVLRVLRQTLPPA